MIYPHQQFNLRLFVRNEGKLKSYESCNDLRAWSHDERQRDLYLREWMKRDMPFCIMPICTVAGLLKSMTCRSRGRVTPRCHPDCKSKLVLDSICSSCHAMKECFKNDENFEKYFIDEELETSHWPCDRCLEALKSIKMFWKIIVEKVFNIKIRNKDIEVFDENQCCHSNSAREVARSWQRDLVHQAVFVKTCTPVSCNSSKHHLSNNCTCKKVKIIPEDDNCCCNLNDKDSSCKIIKPPSPRDSGSALSRMSSKNRVNVTKHQKSRGTGDNASILSCRSSRNTSFKSHKNRVTISDHVKYSSCDKPRKRHCRCTSVRVRTMDMGCDPCDAERENADIRSYVINLEYLQKNLDLQRAELDNLKKENVSLKLEAKNMCTNSKWKDILYCPTTDKDRVALVPKPFECCMEESVCSTPVKDIDSEMIITMKNCKNETFRHISLLQVLHKTNERFPVEIDVEGTCFKREDPINLLTKVQKALGAIVRREMGYARGKKEHGREFDINATFQKVNATRSAPSCVNLLSC